LIHDPALAAEYTQNWNARAAKSRPLNGSASGELPQPQTAAADAAAVPKGPVRGNRRSMIYEWPGCPYYDAISGSHPWNFRTLERPKPLDFDRQRIADEHRWQVSSVPKGNITETSKAIREDPAGPRSEAA
jgi:hypothetical protein